MSFFKPGCRQALTSLGEATARAKILEAPFDLHGAIVTKIEREAEHAAAGRPARATVILL